jgi:undecaprenyl-diphosphatase
VRDEAQVSRFDVVLMTLSQMVALVPGVSRSGITITTGLARGLTREAAVRLSFLISIPVIAAPPAYFAVQVARHKEQLPQGGFDMVAVGVVAAAISGYLAIGYLLKYVRSKSFTPFMVYRVLLGISVLGLVAGRVLR